MSKKNRIIQIEILCYLLLGFVWVLFIYEDFDVSLWRRIAGATIDSIALILSFHAGRYYFPKLEIKRSYSVILIGWLVMLTCVMMLERFFIGELVREAKFENFSVLFFTVFETVRSSTMLSVSVLISWVYHIVHKNNQNALTIYNLQALNKEAELNALKHQINPHFLFNALSNIYSIAYLGDKETPHKIMQLSKMLRYVIYHTEAKFISLQKEIEYLKYYIEFQKFKRKQAQEILFDHQNCNSNVKIAPLLLQPLVENAFKHSRIAYEQNAWVKMKLTTTKDDIYFEIENTISKEPKEQVLNGQGVGLDNIRKRLNLVYKDLHSFNVIDKDSYRVILTLNHINK